MLFVCDPLILARRELAETGMSSSAVVEDLDVLEDLAAELGLGRLCTTVINSFLSVAKKLSATALSKQSPESPSTARSLQLEPSGRRPETRIASPGRNGE
jgi:hypothetical protein